MNKLPIHFFTIVLNGKPFINYHIEVFKNLVIDWHWHIVEGVADLVHDTGWSKELGGEINEKLHDNGLSNDGTSEYLNELKEKYPNNITIYRNSEGKFWDGKLEMVNAPLKNINEKCLLWQIDVDEFWTAEQILIAQELFYRNPEKTAAFYYANFFVGDNLVITSKNTYGNNTSYEWLRTWNFEPGDKWIAHEPPSLCRLKNDSWIDLAKLNPFLHEETRSFDLEFQHYAYVIPKQLKFKEYYYGYKNAVKQWETLQAKTEFPQLLKNYFSWVNDEAVVNKINRKNLKPLIKKISDFFLVFNEEKRNKKKLIFQRTDAIGDNIIASSLIPEIKNNYPGYDIIVVCQDYVAEIYEDCPYVDRIISFNKKLLIKDELYRSYIANKLKRIGADVLLNSVYSRSNICDFLANAAEAKFSLAHIGNTINIDEKDKVISDSYYSEHVKNDSSIINELDIHSAYLSHLKINHEKLFSRMWLNKSDEEFADIVFNKLQLKPEKTIVMFAGAMFELKEYDGFGRALNSICNDKGYTVIALGDGKSKNINQKNLDELTTKTYNLSGLTTLKQAAAIIEKCALAVGVDTSLAHAACATGTKNVIVFGGAHYGRFLPYSSKTSLVSLPLDCFGCNWTCTQKTSFCVKEVNPDFLQNVIIKSLSTDYEKPQIFIQEKLSNSVPSHLFNVNKIIEAIDREKIDINFNENNTAKETFEIVLNKDKPNNIHKAEELIEAGKFNDAKKILLALLVDNNESVVALNDLAVINILENNFGKAETYINSVLLIDPQNSIAHENLNFILQQKSPDGQDHELPKITIVTPSYNQAEFLEETIKSVLSQRYPNLEYIIMDGGSTDGSVEIIKKYEDQLAYWQSKPDGGQYSAIEAGLKKGTGEIMGWINSDDRLYPQSLQTVASIFMNDSNIEWITGRPSMFDSKGEQFYRIDISSWSQQRYLKKDYQFIQQECTFWKKELWEKAGAKLRSDLNLAGDLELWTRFFRYAHLHSVDIFLGGFRKQPNQKTASFLNEYLKEAEDILDSEIDFVNQTGKTPKGKVPLIKLNENSIRKCGSKEELESLIASIDKCIEQNNIKDAISNLKQALVIEPNAYHLIEVLSDLEYKSGNTTDSKLLLWNLIERFQAEEEVYDKLLNYEMEEFRIDNAFGLLKIFKSRFPLSSKYQKEYDKLDSQLKTCRAFTKLFQLDKVEREHEALSNIEAFRTNLYLNFGGKEISPSGKIDISFEEILEVTPNVIVFLENMKMLDFKKYLEEIVQSKIGNSSIENLVDHQSSNTQISSQEVMVSAIVSTYNSEKFIKGCLDDLTTQTIYKKGLLEIVVVNSGSEENEDEIIHDYKSRFENIQYIKTEERETIYQAWNRGIKAAKGKYVTNANTDDRHRPDAYEKMLDQFSYDKEIDLVYADVLQTKISNDTYFSSSNKSQLNWIDFDADLLLFGCYIGPQPMWKKELHDKFGYFDESLKVVGDYEFWLRISRDAKFYHIKETLGLYLFAEDSAEHRDNSLTEQENERVKNKYICKYIRNDEMYEVILDKLNEINKIFKDENYFNSNLIFLKKRKNGIHLEKKIFEFSQNFGVGTNGNTDSIIQTLINLVDDDNAIVDKDFYLGVLYGLRGSYFLTLGDLETAQIHFESALNYDSESSDACAGLAEVFYQSGIYNTAKEMFEWALKLDDKNQFAEEQLQKINRENNMQNTNMAAENSVHFQKLERAENLINNEKYSDARLILNEILNEDNKHVDALNDLSVIEILEGNFYRATERISEILDIDPQNEVAKDNLFNLEKIVDENLITIQNNL